MPSLNVNHRRCYLFHKKICAGPTSEGARMTVQYCLDLSLHILCLELCQNTLEILEPLPVQVLTCQPKRFDRGHRTMPGECTPEGVGEEGRGQTWGIKDWTSGFTA